MKELVLDAQKTGDGKDALQVAKAAYEMHAISEVDYARLSRELATLDAAKSFDKSGG